MEEQKYQSNNSITDGSAIGAPASIDDRNLVTSYQGSASPIYSTDSLEEPLEVHTAQPSLQQPVSLQHRRLIAPFSRRKAMTVSAIITILVIVFTGLAMGMLVRQTSQRNANTPNVPEQQDIAIENGVNSKLPEELQGTQESLLVRGDIVTRGDLKVSAGGFVSVIRFENPTANQTLTLPSASGTICLSSNNCGNASQADQSALQGQVDTVQAQLSNIQSIINSLGQISVPTAGVTELNGQKGSVTLQGSFNRVIVNTSGGVVTLSTPQDLDTNANVQFGSLTLPVAGQIRANTLVQTGAGNAVSIDAGNDMITFVAGGRVFQLPNSGGASQTICTTGATCATGSGTAVILSPGTAQVDGTADASIFINDTGGGHLVHLQSGGVDRFTISNAGNTTIGGSLTISSLGNGFVRSTAGALSVVSAVNLASEVTGTLPIANGGTGSTTGSGARTNLGAAASGANSDITSTTGLNTITPSGALTVGSTSQIFTLQGAANSSIAAGSGANVTTVGFTAPSGVNAITFPTLSGTVCLSSGNCSAAGSAGGDLTGTYPNPTIAKLQGTDLNIVGVASGHILIYNGATSRWENTSVSGDISLSGTGAATINSNAVTTGKIADGNVTNTKLQNSSLTVTAGTGLSGGGAVSLGASTSLAVVYGSTANTSVQGNTAITLTAGTGLSGGGSITLGAGGSSTLNVVYGSTGNTAVQGNTTLTCASGTGNLSGGGNTVTLGAGGTCNSLTITNSPIFTGTLAVQGATATIGASGQQGSVVLYDGGAGASAHRGTVQVVGTLAQDTTYILPDPASATATICLSTGNCAGAGGGITGSGTNGRIAKFTSSGTVADSTLSESGTTVTTSGNIVIQGSNGLTLGTSSSIDGSVAFRNANGTHTVTIQAPTSDPASDLVFRLPSSYGANGDCLQSNGSGGLTFTSCTGGAGGGVTSIDGQTGVVNISNASGSAGTITIDDAGTSTKGIASFSSSNFSVSSGAVSLAAGGVGSTELANNAVTTNKITDGNVTNSKLQNSSVSVGAGSGLINGGSVSLGGSTTLNIGAGDGITVNADDIAVDATVARLNANANFTANLQQGGNDVCTTAGNCAGVGGTGDVLQGGNSFGAAMIVGTNDTQDLQFETNGVTRLTISNTGAATFTGSVTATSFSGNGANLTNLDAGNLTSGVIASARISGSYTGITGVGTITVGTWNGTAISDAYVQDNITISSSGTVDWAALNNYPAACGAGQAITQLGDTITCQAFATGGDGGVNAIGTIDSQTKSADGAVISGTTLYLQTADASNPGLVSTGSQTFAGNKTFNGSVTIAASQSLTIIGGNTASRPGSPTEGMVYFDTTTKQLLTYANGKWQTDRTEAIIVAASNSSQADKDAADYVADGNTGAAADGDQVQINAALTAASGKKVVLLAGTYTVDASVTVPTSTKLMGIGQGAVVTIPNSFNTTINIISLPGNDAVVENLMVDQNTANQTSGTIVGVSSGGYNNTVARTKHINIRSTGIAMSAGSEATAGVVQNNLIDCTNGDPGAASTAVGISITGSTGQNGSTSTAQENSVNNCGTGIRGQSRVLIIDNTIMAGRSAGIDLQSVTYANISDNHVSMLYGNFSNNYGSSALTGTSILRSTITGNTFSYAFSMVTLTTMNSSTFSNNVMDDSANLMLSISGGTGNTIANNVGTDGTANQNRFLFTSMTSSVINDNSIAGINLDSVSHHNQVLSNQIDATGGTTTNRLEINGDNTTVSGNVLYGVGSGLVALRVAATADSTYLAGNRMLNSSGATFLSDVGTNTIYGGQVNDSGNFLLQSAGTIELMKNTNITGTLGVIGAASLTGGATIRGVTVDSATATQDRILVTVAAVGAARFDGTLTNADLTAARTWTLPDADGTICLVGGSCGFASNSGSGSYIQNQFVAAQSASNFWISGVGRTDGALQTPELDTASAVNLNIGSANALGINLNKHVIVASNQVVLLMGGNTASRQGTAQEGMVYFDTTTKKLIVYSNSKWQADRSDAILVAADNSSQAEKDAADYVADGNGVSAGDGDQVEINAALTAASGKKVVLLPGTYVADATILVPNNTTLAGVGKGTLIELADLDASDNLIENSDTTTGTGVTIRDLQLNGRKDLNTAGVQRGIAFTNMGGGTGSTARQGARITGLLVANFRSENILLTSSSNNVISDTTVQASTVEGLQISTSSNNVITGNKFQGNGASGFNANSTSNSNTITGNHAQGNGSAGFSLASGSYSTVSGNTSLGNSYGFFITSSNQTVTGNNAQGNSSAGFYVSGNNNTLSGNTSTGNTSYGFSISADNNTVDGNIAQANQYGIRIDSDHNSVSGNTVNSNTVNGISINNADNNLVSSNRVYDSGGATTNNGIHLAASLSNTIANNVISDTSATTNNYAINISNNTSDNNIITGNTTSGANIQNIGDGTVFGGNILGAGSISGAGTAAAYNGQTNNSGDYQLQPAGTIELMKNTNVTGNLSVTGTATVTGDFTVTSAGNVAFQRNTTDITATGNLNDFNIGTGALFRLNGASAQTITGIAGGTDGRIITIINIAATNATIAQNSPSSTAANRIITGIGSISLPTNTAVQLTYDSAASRWFIVGTTQTSGGAANQQLSNLSGTIAVNTSLTPGTDNTIDLGSSANSWRTLYADTNVLTPTIDTASAIALDIGTINATQINLNKNVVVAAQQTIQFVGGTTAQRPASPAEGMLYFDTTTKQLLTYTNGKWQGDRSTATKIIAPSNASQVAKDSADVVLTGTADQSLINTALTAAAGGKVYILEGTVNVTGTISVPNSTTLAGAGRGTLIMIPNSTNVVFNMITNTTTAGNGTGVTIQDLQLDGNRANNLVATTYGVYLNGMGSGTTTQGAKVTGLWINNFRGGAVYLTSSSNNTITNNVTKNNYDRGFSITSGSNNVIADNISQVTPYGFYLDTATNNTLSGNSAQGSVNDGFRITTNSTGNTITGNTAEGSSANNFIVTSTSTGNTFTGNTSLNSATDGFAIFANNNTFTGNTSYNSASAEFDIGADYNTITGNTIKGTTTSFYGIQMNSANYNTITGNNIADMGANAHNHGIYLSSSDSNNITGNTITDTTHTATNYAINISNNASDANYLADNTLGGGTINDTGTGTIFGGQVNSSGNYVVQPAGTIELMKNTNVTGTLNITSNVDTNGSLTVGNANQFVISNTGVVTSGTWNGSTVGVQYGGTGATTFTQYGVLFGNGTGAVGVTATGSTGQCLLSGNGTAAPNWGACTATDLQGTYNASSPATILLSDNKDFTINTSDTTTDSSIIFNLSCGSCSANGGRFAVQDASVDIFTVLPNGDIRLGTAANNMTLAASNGYKAVLTGTARNSKTILLTPEYAGTVLDPGSGSNNTGTMTSRYDITNRLNYYNWTTTQATNQSYDVVVQVPIPKDFDGWDTNPLSFTGYTTNTTNGTITVQVIKSDNNADTNFSTFLSATPTSASTWSTHTFNSLNSSGYTAGDYLTLRIRLQAPQNGNTRVSNITLNYLSNK